MSEILAAHQAELVELVKSLVEKKPETTAEALELLGKLQAKLGEWVVSGLPEDQAKVASVVLRSVESVNCTSCFKK